MTRPAPADPAAFAEAMREFRVWDQTRAKKYMVGATAHLAPRDRVGKVVDSPKRKKKRDPADPRPLWARAETELPDYKTCGCGRAFTGSGRKCSRCRKQPPIRDCVCADCGRTFRAKGGRLCSPCLRATRANIKPPCKCGKPYYTAGKCRSCYKKQMRRTSATYRATEREANRRYRAKPENREKLNAAQRAWRARLGQTERGRAYLRELRRRREQRERDLEKYSADQLQRVRLRSKRRAKNRRYYQNVMANAEGRARMAEKSRRSYQRRMATPEGRAKLRVMWRKKYQRRQARQAPKAQERRVA